MWLRTLINSIVLLLSIEIGIAQNLEQSYDYAEQNFLLGEYVTAKSAYKRIAFFDTEYKFPVIYQRLGKIYVSEEKYESARYYFEKYESLNQNNEEKLNTRIQISSCFLKEGNPKDAITILLQVKPDSNSINYEKWTLYLAVSYFQDKQFNKSEDLFKKLINPSKYKELRKVFKKNNRLDKKYNKRKVMIMSAFIPGTGQFYTGRWKEGTNSILLVGGFTYLFVRVVSSFTLFDAFLSVYPWVQRYYVGGIKKAGLFTRDVVKRKRSKQYKKILGLVIANQS